MKLHPPHGCHALTELRAIAMSAQGRVRLQNMLSEYQARRALLPRHDQVTHDIAAARVRHALAEHERRSAPPPRGGHRQGARAA
jgi:hypothetical protein